MWFGESFLTEVMFTPASWSDKGVAQEERGNARIWGRSPGDE